MQKIHLQKSAYETVGTKTGTSILTKITGAIILTKILVQNHNGRCVHKNTEILVANIPVLQNENTTKRFYQQQLHSVCTYRILNTNKIIFLKSQCSLEFRPRTTNFNFFRRSVIKSSG